MPRRLNMRRYCVNFDTLESGGLRNRNTKECVLVCVTYKPNRTIIAQYALAPPGLSRAPCASSCRLEGLQVVDLQGLSEQESHGSIIDPAGGTPRPTAQRRCHGANFQDFDPYGAPRHHHLLNRVTGSPEPGAQLPHAAHRLQYDRDLAP